LSQPIEKISLKKAFLFSFLSLALIVGVFFGGVYTYSLGYKSGFIGALNEVAKIPALDFHWQDLGNGDFKLSVYPGKGYGNVSIHVVRFDVLVTQSRNGEVIDIQHSAGTLTNLGKDWIEQQISGTISANGTLYISCSASDTSALTAASTQITSELDANGFTRATAAYASTGVGVWTVTKTFTSSGTQAVQSYGLQHSPTKLSNNNLFGYDSSAVKNTIATDTLQVQWTITIS